MASSPRRIVLWRHGRTAWNRLGRAQGHADVGLDSVGLAQAKRAAGFLTTYQPALVWSSDLVRARQTASELTALTGMEAALDKRLREFDVGARQGMTWEQFRIAFPDFFPDPFGTAADRSVGSRVPGAESAEEVSRRMVAVLSDAATALRPGETGVLVGHGASLRTGLLAFFDVPQELSEMLAGMANCAWSVLEQHGERGWQIIDYNAQTLPQPLELADDLASP